MAIRSPIWDSDGQSGGWSGGSRKKLSSIQLPFGARLFSGAAHRSLKVPSDTRRRNNSDLIKVIYSIGWRDGPAHAAENITKISMRGASFGLHGCVAIHVKIPPVKENFGFIKSKLLSRF